MKITTKIDFKIIDLKSDRAKIKFANEYDLQVRNKIDYILELTKDKYYTFRSMMLFVAEETKSILIHCDEDKEEFIFEYIGV
jgi:hypothetical protein